MKILLLAGEESGVIYAERLKTALLTERPDIEFRGYDTEGFRTADLAVMGFIPVLKKIFYFLRVARTMKRVIDDWRPDAVVTIDYPGLNLKLAAYAKQRGIPAIHLVCPQVWAWHKNRIPKVAAALTKLLCFFPFEPALFAETDLEAKFIGHPMVDVFAHERGQTPAMPPARGGQTPEKRGQTPAMPPARGGQTPEKRGQTPAIPPAKGGQTPEKQGQTPGIDPVGGGLSPVKSGILVAILPGSRAGEISHNLPRLLSSIEILQNKCKEPFRVIIPAANDKAFLAICAQVQQKPDLPIEVVRGGARDLLRQADCAAVASGTATLEAALARCPTVLVYAVSPLLAWFARRVITGVHYIGLANVIWEKSIHNSDKIKIKGRQMGTDPSKTGTDPGKESPHPVGTDPTKLGTDPGKESPHPEGTDPTKQGTDPGKEPTQPVGTDPTKQGTDPGKEPTQPVGTDPGLAPMPELLQEAFTPEAVAEQLKSWLVDEGARRVAVGRLDAAMALLKSDGDALGLAAREIVQTIVSTSGQN